MARNPIEITLGEKSWWIRPTTIGQLEELEQIITEQDQCGVTYGKKIIVAALKRDAAEDAQKIDEVACTQSEIAAATLAILRFAGFIPEAVTETEKVANADA